jgi:UDP-N-acetylglucosamine 2-epimerase (non-hydrolysing)
VKVLSVVGARPQFVKLAPVGRELAARGHRHVIVHTGQHYDHLLSEAFFDDLAICPPDVNLQVGSASSAVQVARILTALDPVLAGHRPDWVLVYGDTNSTLAGALATAERGLPLVHLEAGLRSFDRRMPEERNRIVADHLADLLLAPTEVAVANLAAEGLGSRSVLVGDVMVDTLLLARQQAALSPGEHLPAFLADGPYLLATLHRRETTDDPVFLAAAIGALAACPLPVWLLAHPRLVDRASRIGVPLTSGALRGTGPLPYRSMIAAMTASRGIITDSGGVQKEALALGVPCTTLRARTEWPETLRDGWNVLVSEPRDLAAAVLRQRPAGAPPQPFGDGHAAARIVAELGAGAGPR